MNVIFLKNDGRCKWLENKVLKKLMPEMIKSATEKKKKTMYLIEDWISNDGGKVGVDLKWLNYMGIPVIKNCDDIPKCGDYCIVNTGYDSIVDEEKLLLQKGIDIIDEPCPYIRKIRNIFENLDEEYQHILLCESNHIIMKNFKSLYPKDMILVQMDNYKERIVNEQNGKPLRLIPYVTFLSSHIDQIFNYINTLYPDRKNEKFKTSCMWVSSPSSPIVELENMSLNQLEGIKDALLVTTPGSINKSVVSLVETLRSKGLNVVKISSLIEFRDYEKKHKKSKVLLVRSPIPNNAEKPIVTYINYGLLITYFVSIRDFIKLRCNKYIVITLLRLRTLRYSLFRKS